MVELAQGDVVEVRRGGSDTLRKLSIEIARLGRSAHIRIERRLKDMMPRVGQVVFKQGKPCLALHEAELMQSGLEALLEIEDDASTLDAIISLHEHPNEDVENMIKLYPDASLVLEEDPRYFHQEGEGDWWTNVKVKPSGWNRGARLESYESIVEAPEQIQARSKAMLQRHTSEERFLNTGESLLLDSDDPSPLFSLASELAKHGRPILVISRTDIETLNVEYDLPKASCAWLSNNTGEGCLEPSLEAVRGRVDSFLWGNLRAVVVFEGLEYLASIHSDSRMIGLLRDIADGIHMDDHLLLCTANLNGFDAHWRQHLLRELQPLEQSEIESWLLDPEMLLDHPICAAPSEEEKEWINNELAKALGTSEVQSFTHGGMSGGFDGPEIEEIQQATGNLADMMQEWAQDSVPEDEPLIAQATVNEDGSPSDSWTPTFHSADGTSQTSQPLVSEIHQEASTEEQIEESVVEQVSSEQAAEVIEPKGPRQALRMKRRKPKMPQMKSSKTAVAEVELPEFKQDRIEPNIHSTISHDLSDEAMRQQRAIEEFNQITNEENKEWQQASQQKAASKIATLPQSGLGPKPLDAQHSLDMQAQPQLNPLHARPGVEISHDKEAVRESAAREQKLKDMRQISDEWDKKENQAFKSSSAIYDAQGNLIKRYGGDE